MVRSTPSTRLTTVLLAGAVAVGALAAPAVADEGREGPVVGMPPLEDALGGWVETWTDPDVWVGYVREALEEGHLGAPYPTDPIKPEAFLPNVPVPAGDDVSALPVEPVDLSGITYRWRGERKTVDEFVRTTRTDGVVFVVDGTVVGERYANGYGSDVRHQPWSVTKTFVAAVVGVAHDEGLIASVHDPIERYIAELAGTAWEGVTIEQLLRMESGVHWDEGTPVLLVNTQVQQWIELALDLVTEGALGATRNEFLAALPAAYEPGSEFRYNSGNTQVLAWLTEVVYGTSFDQVLAEKLWQPMGAEHDAVVTADREGAVIASHGLFARPHDFARFGELLRRGGRTPEGRQVVPAAWVEAMTTMSDVSGGTYGYQTWAHPIAGDGAYSASGFQGQKITVVPDTCVTGVRLAHALGARLRDGELTDPDAYGFSIETFEDEWQTMLAAVADAVGGCGSADGAPTPGDVEPTSTDGAAPGADGPDGGSPDPGGARPDVVAETPSAAADVEVARAPLPVTGGGAALVGVLSVLGAAIALPRRLRG